MMLLSAPLLAMTTGSLVGSGLRSAQATPPKRNPNTLAVVAISLIRTHLMSATYAV